MPSAATNDIGSGKSIPVISFAWGPQTLGQYSGNPNDQYAYLWVAILKEDRQAIELYQAIDSSEQPWKAGSPTTGSSYALVKTLSLNAIKGVGHPLSIAITFSPSGRLRLVLAQSLSTLDPPHGRIKFAIDQSDNVMPIFGVDVFRFDGDREITGLVALNTYQLHGRLDQASTIAISAVYNAREDGTRFITCNSVLEFMAPHRVSHSDIWWDSGRRIRVTTRSSVAISGYMKGKWYIVPTNPIASPYGAMQASGAGQILAYDPTSGAIRIVALRPTVPRGQYTPPVVIGYNGDAIQSGGNVIGAPGLVYIGEEQYGAQGEGLKVRATISF